MSATLEKPAACVVLRDRSVSTLPSANAVVRVRSSMSVFWKKTRVLS
ncbi:hypothetical protein [Acidovorax sp. Leaf160]|nr:hypothetical protein [Acidovorax sp. Leaf160]